MAAKSWLESCGACNIERRPPGASRMNPLLQAPNPSRQAPRKQQRRPISRSRRLRKYGVDDGNRTHDNWNHNPALYQLSYAHHIAVLRYNLTEAWCGRRDSNSYSLRRWNLNLVPELGQFAKPFVYKGLARILHRWDTLCNAKFVSQLSRCVPVCPTGFWWAHGSRSRSVQPEPRTRKCVPTQALEASP